MSKKGHFDSVWDALEDDPVRQENLKLRSALMMEIAERIKDQGLTQTQAAEVLHITQPRVTALLKGKINEFRLDSLVDMAHRLGMHVSINVGERLLFTMQHSASAARKSANRPASFSHECVAPQGAGTPRNGPESCRSTYRPRRHVWHRMQQIDASQ